MWEYLNVLKITTIRSKRQEYKVGLFDQNMLLHLATLYELSADTRTEKMVLYGFVYRWNMG